MAGAGNSPPMTTEKFLTILFSHAHGNVFYYSSRGLVERGDRQRNADWLLNGAVWEWSGGSSRVVSVNVIRRINRIVIQNVSLGLLYRTQGLHFDYSRQWWKLWQKSGWKYSLLQGRERVISFERKRPRRKNSFEGSNDKRTPFEEVISRFERSFLDLIQMREIGTKKSFSGKSPFIAKMLTFF